jgi:hypothetical protein
MSERVTPRGWISVERLGWPLFRLVSVNVTKLSVDREGGGSWSTALPRGGSTRE